MENPQSTKENKKKKDMKIEVTEIMNCTLNEKIIVIPSTRDWITDLRVSRRRFK